MRLGWLAAAAAMVCAGQVSAQTFVRFEATGFGTVTPSRVSGPGGSSYASDFRVDFSLLTDIGSYTGPAGATYVGTGNTFSASAANYVTYATGPTSGLLTYNETRIGQGIQLRINYQDTDTVGGLPSAVVGSAATGAIDYSLGDGSSAAFSFLGNIRSLRVLGTSSTFENFSAAAVTGAVPEPASWLTMILGFGVIGWAVRRRRLPARALA